MYFSITLLATAFVGQAFALSIPDGVCVELSRLVSCNVEKRAACNHDNLLRSFLDTRYSDSASSFCSSYIQSTTTQSITTTTTTTAAIQNSKRAPSTSNTNFQGITSYGPIRLSSACSCLITAPLTTTVTTIASTAVVTVQPSYGTCGIGPGYTQGPNDNYLGLIGSGVATVQDCKAICIGQGNCKAFAYASDSQYCTGYSDIIANDNFESVPGSDFLFYDTTCPL